jgi:hypothetical protein
MPDKALESIRDILQLTLLSNPNNVLGALELYNLAYSDNTPIMGTIELDAGETLIFSMAAPEGYVGINTAFYADISVAAVLDWSVSLDGRAYMSSSSFKATAGSVNVNFTGWTPARRSEYRVKNNHNDKVTAFFISYGAFLSVDVWRKIENVLKSAAAQIVAEGKIG